jgi:hypothetical protein
MFDFKNVYETEQFGGQEIRQKLKYLSIIKSKNIFLSTKHCTRQKFIRYFKLYHVLFLFSQYLWLIYKSNWSKNFDKGFYFNFLTGNGVR